MVKSSCTSPCMPLAASSRDCSSLMLQFVVERQSCLSVSPQSYCILVHIACLRCLEQRKMFKGRGKVGSLRGKPEFVLSVVKGCTPERSSVSKPVCVPAASHTATVSRHKTLIAKDRILEYSFCYGYCGPISDQLLFPFLLRFCLLRPLRGRCFLLFAF